MHNSHTAVVSFKILCGFSYCSSLSSSCFAFCFLCELHILCALLHSCSVETRPCLTTQPARRCVCVAVLLKDRSSIGSKTPLTFHQKKGKFAGGTARTNPDHLERIRKVWKEEEEEEESWNDLCPAVLESCDIHVPSRL